MATETKTTVVKVRPSNQDGSSKGKVDTSLNKKKIESSSKVIVDSRQKSTVTKSEVPISLLIDFCDSDLFVRDFFYLVFQLGYRGLFVFLLAFFIYIRPVMWVCSRGFLNYGALSSWILIIGL